ncbi:MAG: (Fe-S)-binding protein [Coriobacteriales bacterium]|jgi:L-lactate dehydrogenase complex protein LldE|nr:(Fe-S)-binding protein [Coriobacteriales bacterium]
MPDKPKITPKVAIFATCINDVMFPETVIATVQLLERLGCTVEFPVEQSCCGQMFTNTGYFREGLGCVRSYVEAFSGYEYIVGPSGSCVTAVRDQHPMLAAQSGDAGLAAAVDDVVRHSYELTEFLCDVLEVEDVGAVFAHKVTYHLTCHSLRFARLGERPLRLMSKVRGLELIELEGFDQCCGFGGTFCVKNPDVSADMASCKAGYAVDTGAEYLVSLDNACLLNIGGVLHRAGSSLKPIHLAEILACGEGGL